MDRILNPELKSRQAPGFKFIKDIKVVDKHTFQLITKAPYPLVLERFYTTFPYDKKWCQKVGEKVIAEKPNGTGAYRLVEWEKGSKAVFVANPDYWRKGLPKIKNVTIRVIPESSTRIAELMNHGVNLISKLDPDKCSMIEEKKGLKVLETPSHRIVFWQFDSMGRAGKTPLTDIRVRKAIWHAIDREKIIDVMFKGHAELLNTCLSPFDFAYDESLKGYEFNPQKAKDLLKEAGYPNGLELDVMYYYPISHQFNQAAMGYLDKVGIKLKMKNYVGNIGQAIKVRDSGKAHDVGNFGWASYMLLDPDGLLPFWFVKSSKKCYTDDPELEKWILEARYSFDKNKRLKLYKKAQKRVIEKAYWMPVLAKKSIYGADSSLLINLNPIETVDVVSAHFE
jgi:peptide/nickel transport system substrate-binding protein